MDIVLSNCVLNLVRHEEKDASFRELYRVVRRGGRIAISDIVSDEEVPEHLRQDPELWSGCISGALRESEFLEALERVGFYGIEIAERSDRPWRTVEGIEFRSLTVTARKGKEGPCLDRGQAVIYRAPWKRVIDDDGHVRQDLQHLPTKPLRGIDRRGAPSDRDSHRGSSALRLQPPLNPRSVRDEGCRLRRDDPAGSRLVRAGRLLLNGVSRPTRPPLSRAGRESRRYGR